MKDHKKFYMKSPKSCRACHGQKLEGTALTRAGAERQLQKSAGTAARVTLAAGAPVGCAVCHGTKYQ